MFARLSLPHARCFDAALSALCVWIVSRLTICARIKPTQRDTWRRKVKCVCRLLCNCSSGNNNKKERKRKEEEEVWAKSEQDRIATARSLLLTKVKQLKAHHHHPVAFFLSLHNQQSTQTGNKSTFARPNTEPIVLQVRLFALSRTHK